MGSGSAHIAGIQLRLSEGITLWLLFPSYMRLFQHTLDASQPRQRWDDIQCNRLRGSLLLHGIEGRFKLLHSVVACGITARAKHDILTCMVSSVSLNKVDPR